jgi:hypothetical protein
MRVVHVIPSAFHYFDDIRESAFKIIKKLEEAGVDCEAITLQYAPPSRSVKAEVGQATGGSHRFEKEEDIDGVIASFGEYDLVHLHCPFLGAGRKILKWKKQHPESRLVLTYYRGISLADLMSFVIVLYNQYYLRRLLPAASALSCLRFDILPEKWRKGKRGKKWLGLLDNNETTHLTAAGDEVKLTLLECEEAASRILFIYKNID